jgi:hypothetical protein
VQNLFEPEFVSLMDRDEKEFVVMYGTRQALLKVDEILDSKVFVI